ncbi:MAG: DUF1295 domain-containing protein [Pseudomonadota bacterium]
MSAFVPYLVPLGMTLVGFCLLWPLSVLRTDASIVDGWWAPGFLAQVLLVVALHPPLDNRAALIVALMALWSARLTWVLVRRRIREGGEDPRYTSLREAWGESFWWKSLFVVFILQGVIQWAIALGPISALLAPSAALGALSVVGLLIAMLGIVLETKADAELDQFKRSNDGPILCKTGLRSLIRHPNYVGEILFWIGLGAIIAEVSVWGAILSPVLIAIFLVKVSGAPMLDERLSATRPDYDDYRRHVPAFIPRLRRRAIA